MKPIIAICLLFVILATSTLSQSLWLDEAINVTAARDLGISELITDYSLGDFHPPIYHAILHYWIKFQGSDEIAVRFPSVIFSTITIYFTYLISRHLFGNSKITLFGYQIPQNLIAPILLSTSGLQLYYAGEARMYALAAMGATICIYYLLHLRFKNQLLVNISPLNFKSHSQIFHFMPFYSLAFILALSLTLYTDYVPWILLPLFFLLLPLHSLISFLTTAPWWPLFFVQLGNGLGVAASHPGWNQVVGGFSLKNILLIPIKFTIGRVSIDDPTLYALALALPIITIIWLFFITTRELKSKITPNHLIFAWLIAPITLGIVLSLKISLLSYFRFLFLLPAFYLILTIGLGRLKPTKPTMFFAVLFLTNIISTSAYIFLPGFHRENWRSLASWVESESLEHQSAITLFPSLAQAAPYLYYTSTPRAVDSTDFDHVYDAVFLVRYVQEIFDPTDQKRLKLLEYGYTKQKEQTFNGVVVWLYTKDTKIYALRNNPPPTPTDSPNKYSP